MSVDRKFLNTTFAEFNITEGCPFSDASFAPYRFNGGKGISGGVVFCEGALFHHVKQNCMRCTWLHKNRWHLAISVIVCMLESAR